MDESQTNPRAPQPCTCMTDTLSDLPPELRPKQVPRKSSLRKVTCPACGLTYWTNRQTDLCMDCERKGAGGGRLDHTAR